MCVRWAEIYWAWYMGIVKPHGVPETNGQNHILPAVFLLEIPSNKCNLVLSVGLGVL